MPVTSPHPLLLNSQERHELCELLKVAQASLLELSSSLDRQHVSASLVTTIEHYASRACELRMKIGG